MAGLGSSPSVLSPIDLEAAARIAMSSLSLSRISAVIPAPDNPSSAPLTKQAGAPASIQLAETVESSKLNRVTASPVGSSSPVEAPSTFSKKTLTGMPGIELPGIVSDPFAGIFLPGVAT